MGHPYVSSGQVVSDAGVTAEIEIPDGRVECCRPHCHWGFHGIGVVVLIRVEFDLESVVEPPVDENCLESDVNPLVGREAEDGVDDLGRVTELLVPSEPSRGRR